MYAYCLFTILLVALGGLGVPKSSSPAFRFRTLTFYLGIEGPCASVVTHVVRLNRLPGSLKCFGMGLGSHLLQSVLVWYSTDAALPLLS